MKAIVLSCDKYVKFADHLIATYQNLWPANPFRFRIPYNLNYPKFLKEKYGEKIQLIPTKEAIKATILELISDLNEEEWVYWCMDDHYPIELKIEEIYKIYSYITNNKIKNNKISSISLCRTKNLSLNYKDIILGNNSKPFLERRDYKGIWMHQFLKVKVLRYLFSNFPDNAFNAHLMDRFKRELKIPQDQVFLVSKKSMIILGESTYRGQLTRNCVESFEKHNLQLPSNFVVASDKYVIRGQLYYNWLINYSLVNNLRSMLKSLKK